MNQEERNSGTDDDDAKVLTLRIVSVSIEGAKEVTHSSYSSSVGDTFALPPL